MNTNKILIIEDDVFLSKMYSIKLKQEGLESLIVNDGTLAISLAKDYQPALILLDIIMPKKNGYDLLKEMQGDPELKLIPVIMISKISNEDDRDKAKKLGAKLYMYKMDYAFTEVIKVIKGYLE